jgi:hypothetical protein
MNENEPKPSGHGRQDHSAPAGAAQPGAALPVDDPRAVAKRRREAEEKLEQHQHEAKEEAREAGHNAGHNDRPD